MVCLRQKNDGIWMTSEIYREKRLGSDEASITPGPSGKYISI